MQKTLVPKQNKWSQYGIEFLSFAFVLDFLIFIWVRQKPECCDADVYFSEASVIRAHGLFPSNGTTWLTPGHNYLYPTFIFLARSIGFTTRASITILQFALIVLACIIISMRLSRVLKMSSIQLSGITLLIASFPILAFSGYLLTEALASFLLILWVGFWLELSLKEFSPLKRKLLIFDISLVASLLWMMRPSFLWIPLTNFICILLLEYEKRTSKISLVKNMLVTTFLALIVTVTVAIPQYLITKTSRSMLNGLFDFDVLAINKTFESSIFRYITNISGCGPLQLIFSPYGQTTNGLYPPHFHTSPVYRLVAFITRWCSGWDAVPSPLTYVYHLSIFPWVFLSALSGFLICAPIFLIRPQKDSLDEVGNRFRFAEIGIIFMFFVSQLAAGMMHGEIRYNVAGWIIAGLSILLLPQHFRSGFPFKHYITASLIVSFFVIVVGQLTLSLSQFWIACVN